MTKPRLTNEMIQEDPMKGVLLALGILEQKRINEKALTQQHTVSFQEAGWKMTLETPQGNIGLWYSWLEDHLLLVYPKQWHVPNDILESTLHVSPAQTVEHKITNYGSTHTVQKKWASFYSERMETGGRVWIEQVPAQPHVVRFPFIQNQELEEWSLNKETGNMIYTHMFSGNTKEELDAPTTNKKSIRPFRDRFLSLALEIAKQHGGVQSIHVEFDLTILIPELLFTLQYQNIHSFKGNEKIAFIWGDNFTHATKNNEEIVLRTANSICPWITIRKITTSDTNVTLQTIHNVLTL